MEKLAKIKEKQEGESEWVRESERGRKDLKWILNSLFRQQQIVALHSLWWASEKDKYMEREMERKRANMWLYIYTYIYKCEN